MTDNNYIKLYTILLLYFIVCFYASPLLSFFLIILTLTTVRVDNFFYRAPLVFLAFISGAIVYASRIVGNIYGDDFNNEYYPMYEEVYEGSSIFESSFGGGVEFGLSLYFKILSWTLPHLNQAQVILAVTLLCVTLFYVWIELFLFKDQYISNKSLFLASTLVFFGFFVTTQLMRQAISTVFILYTLSFFKHKRYLLSLISLLIGVIFHLTVIVFVIIYYILSYSDRKKKLILVGLFFFFGFFFINFLSIIASSGLFFGIVSKFLYYLKNTESGIFTAYYWKLLIPAAMMACFFCKSENKFFKEILIFSTACYMCIITIPFASDRVFMLLTVYMLGGLVYIAFSKIENIFKLLIILFCLFRFLTLGPLYPNQCGKVVLCLWGAYPWLGSFL